MSENVTRLELAGVLTRVAARMEQSGDAANEALHAVARDLGGDAPSVEPLESLVEEFAGWWGLHREGSVNAAYARVDFFVKAARALIEKTGEDEIQRGMADGFDRAARAIAAADRILDGAYKGPQDSGGFVDLRPALRGAIVAGLLAWRP